MLRGICQGCRRTSWLDEDALCPNCMKGKIKNNPNKKKSALEISNEIGFHFTKEPTIAELLQEDFQRLDNSLKDLGKSDSAIEYAPHVRNYMNVVIDRLNKIKSKLELECKSSESYFE